MPAFVVYLSVFVHYQLHLFERSASVLFSIGFERSMMATIAQLRYCQVFSSSIANANPLEGRKSVFTNERFVDFKGKFSALPLFAEINYFRGDGGAQKLSRQLINEGKGVEDTYWELVIKDIQDACELFEPIYDATGGEDGYVSVQVSPRLALDTEGTVEAAKWLHKRVNCRNVYIKIPATAECIPSIKQVISLGIGVTVTLIFSLPQYEAVIDAYMEGLESFKGDDLSKITSAAAFYVSRVDTLLDKKLENIGTDDALALRGKAAVAQAVLAYKLYQEKFRGPRWEALERRGARKQRVMWAATNVKNPASPDTLYVNPLIGPESITTMPDLALQAFMDHGKVSRTIDANFEEAKNIYNAIEKIGIDWAEVGSLLELEGVESFKKSLDSLLVILGGKADLLKT